MLLKDFIERMLKQLDGLDKTNRAELDILVRLESSLAFDSLKQKLIEMENSASPGDHANEKTLDPVIDILKMRWRSIRLTDASYCHAPDSLASRAYLKMASELGLLTGKKPYHYLFPVTKDDVWDPDACVTSKGTLHDLKLNEFVFADNWKSGETRLKIPKPAQNLTLAAIHEQNVGEPIEVLKCLKTAATTTYRVLETTCILPARNLVAAEEARISLHSIAAGIIATNLKRDMTVDPLDIESSLRLERERGIFVVRSTYGKEGKDRLLTIIMSRNDNISSLARIMSGFVPQGEWSSFLKEMSADDLRKIILSNKKYRDVAANAELYYGDKSYNAAVLYSVIYLYKADRSQQSGDHTTTYGWLGNAYKKHEKLAAADALLQYLSGNLNISLNQFLLSYQVPAGVDRKRWEGAIYDGDLGHIAIAITKRIDLHQEPTAMHSFLY